jgi:hypothetical protein
MILLYSGSTDITEYLERNTLRITEQLNNRVDTMSLTLNNYSVSEGLLMQAFEGFQLTEQALSGQPILQVDDTFEYEQKFKAGDRILIDIKGVNEKRYYILSIDHSLKQITLTTNLETTLPRATKCGRLIFAGNVSKSPQKELGYSEIFSQNVSVNDFTTLFDSENVVETYTNMYTREIIGRIIYEFCANTVSLDLDTFETAWTQGGVGLAMVNDSERIAGNYSQATGMSGPGTATWSKTITSKNISALDTIRLWWKSRYTEGEHILSIKYRVGNDAGNYYEWETPIQGVNFEDCWNYDSFKKTDALEVGSVNDTAITWLQIVAVSDIAISSGGLKFDHSLASFEGFTLVNVERGAKKFGEVRVPYKKPTVIIESLSKLQNYFWYVDYERDLHFFAYDSRPAPFNIDDSSLNFNDLTITADMSQIVNFQIVKGGEAPAEGLRVQDQTADGEQDSFRLDYKPKGIRVYVDTGSGFVEKTIGVENLVDATTVDFLFNFNEKIVKNSEAPRLSAGDVIRFTYYPYMSARVVYKDPASIAKMKIIMGGNGIRAGTPIDYPDAQTWEETRDRARAEVEAKKNAIVTADFITEQDGLSSGQIITITDTERGFSEPLLIQKITRMSKNNERAKYSVSAATSLFGYIEFFQILLQRGDKSGIDITSLVDKVNPVDETIIISDEYTFTLKDHVFHFSSLLRKWIDFVFEQGTETTSGRIGEPERYSQWYASFSGSETGEIGFDESSNYNTGKALRIVAVSGGNGKAAQARHITRIHAKPSKDFTVDVWLEIPTALSNVDTGGGAKFEIVEYATKYSTTALATHLVFSQEVEAQDFGIHSIGFTTNVATNFFELRATLDEASGEMSIGDIKIEEQGTDTATNPASLGFSQFS